MSVNTVREVHEFMVDCFERHSDRLENLKVDIDRMENELFKLKEKKAEMEFDKDILSKSIEAYQATAFAYDKIKLEGVKL